MIKKLISLLVVTICLCTAIFFSATYIRGNVIITRSVVVDKKTCNIYVSKSEVKILQLTDIQTYNIQQCEAVYPMVRAMVESTDPDILVLTGDNIADASTREVLDAMISLLDSFEIPWALVFGNHDRESLVPMEEICETIENSNYGILKTGDLLDRYGNYYYNLYINGRLSRSLIFMDSAQSNFTKEQVDWYRDTVNSIENKSKKKIKSFVFYHIPVCEVTEAHELYKLDSSIGTGVQNEPVCDQGINTGFFDVAKELRSTDAMFYGHDHVNTTMLNYEGILLCYGIKIGHTSYFDASIQGANLITVTSNDFKVERIFCQ